MRKLGAALALGAAAVLGMTACGPATDRGDVIEKNYDEPYSYMYYQCYSYKSDGQCSYGMWTDKHVPARYEVRVKDDTGTEAWLSVTEHEYSELEVGDWYAVGR